jgi:hypothetical protein
MIKVSFNRRSIRLRFKFSCIQIIVRNRRHRIHLERKGLILNPIEGLLNFSVSEFVCLRLLIFSPVLLRPWLPFASSYRLHHHRLHLTFTASWPFNQFEIRFAFLIAFGFHFASCINSKTFSQDFLLFDADWVAMR